MANGIHAVPLTEGGFDDYVQSHPYAFINFYAPWCIWCQRLEPTWEAMAEEVDASEDLEVDVAKVDCVANRNLCGAQRIQAFPTLRFFKDGKQYGLDYRQDRTVQALTAFLKQKVELEKTMEDWHPRRCARGVPSRRGASTPSTRLAFIRRGRGWFLFRV